LVKELDFYDQEGKSDTIQQPIDCAHPCGLVIHCLHVRPDVHAAISDLGDTSAYRTAGYSSSAPPTGVPLTETTLERSNSMKVRLRVEEDELTATLIASKTTQDFISLLPLTLTLVAISPITLPGAIWRFSYAISSTQVDLFSWERSTATSKL
jgi:hypothetical protein